jgi:hypothetical protein
MIAVEALTIREKQLIELRIYSEKFLHYKISNIKYLFDFLFFDEVF